MTDLQDPELKCKFLGHRGTVTCLEFNPNDTQLASGGVDSFVTVWHCHQQKKAYRYMGHEGSITCVTYSPSGDILASSSVDRTVRLWKPTINGDPSSFKGHTGSVRCVRFSPRGQHILTASNDKTLKLWSCDRYKFIYSMCEHTNWVKSADFSSDGQLIVSGGDDKSVKVWAVNSQKSVHTFSDLPGCVNEVAFIPGGNCVVAAIRNYVKLWDIRVNKLLQVFKLQDGVVFSSIAFNPTTNYLLTGLSDAMIKVYDLSKGRLCYTLQSNEGGVTAVCFANSGQYFASAGTDAEVQFWKSNF